MRQLVFSGFLSLLVGAAMPHAALAQNWPSKPIKLITSAAPGGVVDIYARRHQPHLQAELGKFSWSPLFTARLHPSLQLESLCPWVFLVQTACPCCPTYPQWQSKV